MFDLDPLDIAEAVAVASVLDSCYCGDGDGACPRHAPSWREASDSVTRRAIARRRLLTEAYGAAGVPSLR